MSIVHRHPAAARHQRGIALITAMLVVSLAVIAATAMLGFTHLAIFRSNALLETERANWYADGVDAWVKTILLRDAEDNQYDALTDVWASPIDYLPIDQGFMSGGVIDMQGRFNLNNLGLSDLQTYPEYAQQFERLLANIQGIDPFAASALAPAIRDWIDSDQEPTGGDGAEDSEYQRLTPPYRTAGRPMQSVTELMAVRGMTREIYQRLLPYVCALPEVTAINVNTAPEPVLFSLMATPSNGLKDFATNRATQPAENISDFDEQAQLGANDAGNSATVSSRYFQLEAQATVGNSRVAIYSLYLRPSTGTPQVLARSTDSP